MAKVVTHKLLSIDLDGTLLSPIFRIAKKRDCLAIQEYMNCGGMAFINSGRTPGAAYRYMEKINRLGKCKMNFISCLNGAYIKDFNDNEVISKQMPHQCAKQILELVKSVDAKHTYCWFYFTHDIENNIIQSSPLPWWRKLFPYSKVIKLQNKDDLTCCKITIICKSKKTIAKVYDRLFAAKLDNQVKIVHTSKRLIEITAKGIDKGYSLRYFSQKYKIPKEQICSLGDTPNDLAAFENSGLAIAIKPANITLINKVDHIIPKKLCGVSKAIYTHLLREGK